MRILRFSFIAFLLIFFLATVFESNLHRFKSTIELDDALKNELLNLGTKALASGDVPVGAVLMYNGNVIGRGYNTVYQDSIASGHAEINAINRAMKSLGPVNFTKLDRRNLILVTTYEPCEMCMGTLQHYNIRQVHYLKGKTLTMKLKEQLKSFYYQISKRKTSGSSLQDSLFHLHPDYPLKQKATP